MGGQTTHNKATASGSSGYYDDYGNYVDSSGSGGDGGSSGPTDEQRRAADQLADVASHNVSALQNKYAQGRNVYDISDQQSRTLADTQTRQNKRNMSDDWFSQIKKLQGTANTLKGTSGESLNGSNYYQLLDLLERADADIDSETLSTQRRNQDTINNDLYEALSQSVNGRNELAADTEYSMKQVANDFNAQLASMHPDLFDEKAGDWWATGDGWYEGNKVPAATITEQGFYRGPNEQYEANKMYEQNTSNASAANTDYWDKMLKNYNKRS